MIRFACPVYPRLRVHRGNNTYIEFIDGETYVDDVDAMLLRQVDNVTEQGIARDVRGKPMQEYPLAANLVSWYSIVLGTGDGFGNSAERMIAALEAAGQPVSIDPSIPTTGETLLTTIRARKYQHGSVRVAYAPPSANFLAKFRNQASLGFSMWEDSLLPRLWDPFIAGVDALAAPSRFCERLFRERLTELGSKVPVLYVPLGVQTDFFAYQRRDRHPTQAFTFLHSCTSTYDERKGVTDAVDAFREAFTNGENVKLVVRARIGSVETHGDERIEQRIRMITEAEKRDLLYEAHALVYPSRGEGLGLIPLEAIATGLPVICAANTGMLDYGDLVSISVPCDPEPSRIKIVGYDSFEAGGMWAVPRRTDLVLAMKRMYERYREYVAKAARSAKAVQAWGYDQTAIALRAAIEVAREAHRAEATTDARLS